MKTKRVAKSALFTSVLALVLCVSMLVGTTFAWFTDSVTSGNNIIAAGNLDVELVHTNAQVKEAATVADATNLFLDLNGNEILWEPGVVSYENLTVKNVGTLALKYQMGINFSDVNTLEGHGLSEALKVGVVEGGVKATDRAGVIAEVDNWTALTSFELTGELKAGETDSSKEVGLVIYWQPGENDNTWNANNGKVTSNGEELQIDLGVILTATQLTHENDSFDNMYDDGAMYPGEVGTEEDLAAALAKGGNIRLANDITTETGFLLENPADDIVLDLNDHTLTATGEKAKLFSVGGNADLTIYGGKLVADSTNHMTNDTGTSTGASTSVYFWSSGDLTMTDVEIEGSIRGGHRAVDVYSGNAVLTNVDITTSYGSGVNAGSGEASGTPANVVLNDCSITVNGMYSAPYNSVCFSVMGCGEMTINSGEYTLINNNTYATGDTHGGWVGIVMNSGGVLTINGGNFTNVPAEGFMEAYERAVIEAENLNPAVAVVNLNGGTFKPQMKNVVSGYGDVNYPVINGELIDNGDGTWTAQKKTVPDGAEFVADGLYQDAEGNYLITSAAGFDAMREMVAGEEPYENDGTWILYNDIDLNGVNWTPIAGFHGIFDGNKKTISNMNASFLDKNELGGTDNSKRGLPTIKNVTFDNAVISGKEYVGVVVGNAVGVTIENVKVTRAEVTGTKYVGGIVGYVYTTRSTITGCTVSGSTIKADGDDANGKVGGIVGFIAIGELTGNKVTDCKISGPECIGGIAGRGGSGDTIAVIYGNTVSGNTVTGKDTATVGDVIGESLNVQDHA